MNNIYLIPLDLEHCVYDPVKQCKVWRKDDVKHRANELPAVIYDNGTKKWYVKGTLKRGDDKRPAIEHADGTHKWYKDGMIHRVLHADGTEEWYKDDVFHRENDMPAVIGADGTKEWYIRGKRHRSGDKPAVVSADGTVQYYKHGLLKPVTRNHRPVVNTVVPAPLQDRKCKAKKPVRIDRKYSAVYTKLNNAIRKSIINKAPLHEEFFGKWPTHIADPICHSQSFNVNIWFQLNDSRADALRFVEKSYPDVILEFSVISKTRITQKGSRTVAYLVVDRA